MFPIYKCDGAKNMRPDATLIIRRSEKRDSLRSIQDEDVRIYASLISNRAKRSFRQVTRIVWNRSVPVGSGIEPDFVTTGGLTIKFEAALLQFLNYFPIVKTREPTRLGCDYDGVISRASAMVCPWAIDPGTCSEVARKALAATVPPGPEWLLPWRLAICSKCQLSQPKGVGDYRD